MVIFCFGFVLLFGAPYLPTLRKQQLQALALLDLKKGDTLLELGCGDGRLLVCAAKKGIKSVGYELNPMVFIVAKIVTFRYRKLARVEYGNFWHKTWPPADGIYVFLHTRFMPRLNRYVANYSKTTSVKLVSYAFEIPGKEVIKSQDAMYLYDYQ